MILLFNYGGIKYKLLFEFKLQKLFSLERSVGMRPM
jgi:hypothetical protein